MRLPRRSVDYRDGVLEVVDTTELPGRLVVLLLRSTDEVVEAVAALRVRGAPNLGVTGAAAVAQAARASAAATAGGVLADARAAGALVAETRPTAVNLAWGVREALLAGEGAVGAGPAALVAACEAAARRIADEDEAACLAMARHGLALVPRRARVLTHCNTGWLATAGLGTAFGVVRHAHEQGLAPSLWVDETRPLLQGARLTAWEAATFGIAHRVIADAAAGGLMAGGQVDLVVTGADRVCANGDVANKVGTYPLAVLARHHGIPFYVAAPTSTIDLATADGAAVRIEERDRAEVTAFAGRRVAPAASEALNPAFDVTPAELVTALITECGIASPVANATILALLDGLGDGSGPAGAGGSEPAGTA